MFISTPGEFTDPSHLSRNTELHSRIKVSRMLVSAGKFWHCASLNSWRANTNRYSRCAEDTMARASCVPDSCPHAINNEKVYSNSPRDRWADLPTETLEGLSSTGSIQTWSRRLQITPGRKLGSSLWFSPRKPQRWAKAIIEKTWMIHYCHDESQ